MQTRWQHAAGKLGRILIVQRSIQPYLRHEAQRRFAPALARALAVDGKRLFNERADGQAGIQTGHAVLKQKLQGMGNARPVPCIDLGLRYFQIL